MNPLPAAAAGRRSAARIWRERGGAAAVEFAFLLPLALVLLMALIDFTRAFNERKRVTLISSTISDLISQQPTTDGLPIASLDSIVTGGTAIMTPYPTNKLAITVSAVQLTPKPDGSCCQAKVQWSATRGGTMRPCNTLLAQVSSAVTPAPGNMLAAMLDSSLLTNSASAQLIITDVVNSYTPLFGELALYFSGAPQRTSYRILRAWGNLGLQSGSSAVAGEQTKICFSP